MARGSRDGVRRMDDQIDQIEELGFDDAATLGDGDVVEAAVDGAVVRCVVIAVVELGEDEAGEPLPWALLLPESETDAPSPALLVAPWHTEGRPLTCVDEGEMPAGIEDVLGHLVDLAEAAPPSVVAFE